MVRAEVGEDLGADALVAQVGREAELEFASTVSCPFVLQLVRPKLVRRVRSLGLPAGGRGRRPPSSSIRAMPALELLAAVAAEGVEDVAGQALRVHADEHLLAFGTSPFTSATCSLA